LAGLFVLVNLRSCGAVSAQAPGQGQAPDASAPGTSSQDAGQPRGRRGDREGRGRPVFGKISAIGSDSLEGTDPDGNKVTLSLTSSTEFKKDRQPAKVTDFKAGDSIMVRTDRAYGKGMTALMVASGQFDARNGQAGPRGPAGGFGGGMSGKLGKDL